MSWWAHVKTRVIIEKQDSFETKNQVRSEMEKIFGKQCTWEDPLELHDDLWKNVKAYLPTGSEGTLRMDIRHGHYDDDDDEQRHSVWAIDICGDLRDVYYYQEIDEWFVGSMVKLREQRKVISYSFYAEDEVENICRKQHFWHKIYVSAK